MQRVLTHFYKTIIITDKLGYQLVQDFIKIYDLDNVSDKQLFNLFYKFSYERIHNEDHKELVQEVLAVEYEKIKLKSNSRTIKKIALQEKELNIKRERILYLNEKEISKKKFIVSSFVNYYESFWKFIWDEATDNFNILENLAQPKGDYYFLYQKTGIYDEVSLNNILEFPINKYDYFLLQIFEEPKEVDTAMSEFIEVFDYDTQNEYLELKKQATSMIKNLIFRKFIVLDV